MNSDFKDLLRVFAEEEFEYLIVGAYAVIHHSQPRYTKYLDLWLWPTAGNARRVVRAFRKFGILLIEVTEEDLATEGLQYLIGSPPSQFDFLTSLPGLPNFEDAWNHRDSGMIGDVPLHFLGKSDLITAIKRAARLQDLADIEEITRGDVDV